ncbi:MAG: hypothetical protein QM703_02195 [Gemmatales bacterium]
MSATRFRRSREHALPIRCGSPAHVDLTAHVDFQALAQGAEDADARVHGPVEQGTFLRRLGIATRAATLMSKANVQNSADIAAALKRLTGTGRGGMGSLFKVIGVSHPDMRELAGFEEEPLPTATSTPRRAAS